MTEIAMKNHHAGAIEICPHQGTKSGEATPRSVQENFDARPGNQMELSFSPKTSLLLFNEV